MVCLDTNVIIDFLLGEKTAVQKINELRAKGAGLFTTVVTLYELMRDTNEQKMLIIDGMLEGMKIYGLDEFSTRKAIWIYKELKSKGAMINEFDILIAGIAMSNNETLLTRDNDFKRIGYDNVQII
jgi:tRNA(fMet)-specific endonuclease VapC